MPHVEIGPVAPDEVIVMKPPATPIEHTSRPQTCFLSSELAYALFTGGRAKPQSDELAVPATLQAPAAARRWASAACPSLAADLRLVVSELVTNSIQHGRPRKDGTVMLTLVHASDAALLAVTDRGSPTGTTPHLRRASWDIEGGRGLHLVADLSDQWGVVIAAEDTTVWAHLSC